LAKLGAPPNQTVRAFLRELLVEFGPLLRLRLGRQGLRLLNMYRSRNVTTGLIDLGGYPVPEGRFAGGAGP